MKDVKTGRAISIRNAQLQESLSSWEMNQMKIVNEKKKLTA